MTAYVIRLGAACATLALALVGCGTDFSESSATTEPTATQLDIDTNQLLFDSLPDDIRQSGVVRVATDVPAPPYEMFVSEGSEEITGIDYDLGQALGAKLGVAFEFSQQRFDGLIPAIQASQYDVIMAGMTSSPERQEVLDFVEYFTSGTAFMVREGNPEDIASVSDLCGKTVAVQSGVQQVGFLEEQQQVCRDAGEQEIILMTLPKFSDTQLALTSGKAVAIATDKATADYAAATVGDGAVFDVADDPEAPAGYNEQAVGIGVAKNQPELTEAIQQALQELMDDGTYLTILERYGVEDGALQVATLNGQ